MRTKRKHRRSGTYVSKWMYALIVRSAKFNVIQPIITPAMKRRVTVQFGKQCFRCGATTRLQFDHHLPLCKGNPLVFGNICLLCRGCNMAKGTLHPEVFYTPTQLANVQRLLAQQRTW